MKKLLNNVYFVCAMAVVALSYVGYKVYPFIFDSQADLAEAGVDTLLDAIGADNGPSGNAISQADVSAIAVNWQITPTRNPFTPYNNRLVDNDNTEGDLADTVAQLAEIPQLSAIIINKNKRLAMINHGIYEVGQSINSYKITSIEPDHVDISDSGGSKRLTLNK